MRLAALPDGPVSLEPEGRQHELRAAKRKNPRAWDPNRHRQRELIGCARAARKAKSGLAINKETMAANTG